MNPKSITVTLTLKIETHFLHMTLWLIMMYYHSEFGYKWFSNSSKLTLTETFNLDLEHSNPIFSLDTSLLMMIYHQIEFGCKRLIGLELIKDIVQTTIFQLYKPILWPWPWRENPIFLHDIPAHGGAPQSEVWLQKVAYKHSAEWEQIRVTSVTSLTAEDTPVLSLL